MRGLVVVSVGLALVVAGVSEWHLERRCERPAPGVVCGSADRGLVAALVAVGLLVSAVGLGEAWRRYRRVR